MSRIENQIARQPYARYYEMPLSCIRPSGWLEKTLRKQAAGLTGHMEVAGFPFNTPGWGCERVDKREGGDSWWPYEQTGYWLDGAVRCGHLLAHQGLLKQSSQPIDYVLSHAAPDGYLGPDHLRTPGQMNFWAHAVLFRALAARFSANGDRKIPRAMQKHFLCGASEYTQGREVVCIESMLWTYRQTGDRRLLDLALAAFQRHNRSDAERGGWFWDDATTVPGMLEHTPPFTHGVSYNEFGKLPAIVYSYTGNRGYLEATLNAYRKLDRYHMMADGLHSSSEVLCGNDSLALHELCNVADYTWSLGYLAMITGDASWADKIEQAVFNAGLGSVKNDFKALQYFTACNQVVADERSCNALVFRGRSSQAFWPKPGTECCSGNMNRFLPNYACRMWMRDSDGFPVAMLYGPGQLHMQLGRTPVTIRQETHYPFSDRIEFHIDAPKSKEFILTLRIPGWCKSPELWINGKRHRAVLRAGTFYKLRRTYKSGDIITLILPAEVRMEYWDRGGVSLHRGPLLFAFAPQERWDTLAPDEGSCEKFPRYNCYAASPWNFALEVNENTLRDLRPVWNRMPAYPWSAEKPPMELHVPARQVKGWQIDRRDSLQVPDDELAYHLRKDRTYHTVSEGPYRFTPPLPDPYQLDSRLAKKQETIRLIPYGCTHLRIGIFPARSFLNNVLP